jgi:hypothetical protein
VPTVPAALREIVAAPSSDRLLVTGRRGQRFDLDIRDRDPSEFATFGDGRYLGFAWMGYEAYGYVMVDRDAPAGSESISTGQAPTFSPDGRRFAAAELSGAGYSDLEGVGVWELGDGETAQLVFSSALPEGQDWRIDAWRGPDCVLLSGVAADWQPAEGQECEAALPRAPRLRFSVDLGGAEPVLRNDPSGTGCP